MAMGERAQIGAQRRGRPDPVEQAAHGAVPERIEVIDAVSAGEHPGDDAGRLGHRVRAGHRHQPAHQLVQTSQLRQPQHRNQASSQHEIRVIENRTGRVRCSH